MFKGCLLIESQRLFLDGLPKRKESKADQKPPGEEYSRKRLRQWVSHGARLKWSLLTELVGGRE